MNLKKILAAAALTFLLAGCGTGLSDTEAKEFAQNFINENLLSGDMTAEVKSIEKKSGMWSLDIALSNGQEVQSLLSLDGEIFVPEAIYISEIEAAATEGAAAAEEAQAAALAEVPKSEKPVIELFVMSHCPYGTQSEKAVIPALDVLGDAVDFQLKFVNYAMHGEKEVNEQLREFAISENYPEKLIPYLREFLAASDSDAALAAVGISSEDIAEKIAAVDAEFAIIENLNNKDLWLTNQAGEPSYPHFNIHSAKGTEYGVQGSPTLVVNGQKVEGAARTPASMLSVFCAAFEEVPESCATEISSASPSAGFGWGEGAAAAGAGECS